MRIVSVLLLAVWTVLNLTLAIVSRKKLFVSAFFAASGVLIASGLLLSSPLVVTVGLAGSLVAPVLYGHRVLRENHLSHHLVRGVVVIAMAVAYWLS